MSDKAQAIQGELKNRSVFTHRKYVMGIPHRPFVASAALVLFGVILLFAYTRWWLAVPLGLIFAALVMVPVYLVHQSDPDAYMVWIRAYFVAPSLRSSSVIKRRRVIVLSESPTELSATPLSNYENLK